MTELIICFIDNILVKNHITALLGIGQSLQKRPASIRRKVVSFLSLAELSIFKPLKMKNID
jgi:hypothetical protein